MTTPQTTRTSDGLDLAEAPAFMEVQFPVSKISKESYKERKAVAGQTLTAVGKWWGRKPLVLVRAAVLGMLLPSTEDPAADRETFLSLMTMDDEGLQRRVDGSIPARAVYSRMTESERRESFATSASGPKWTKGLPSRERERLQRLAFLRMSYDEKLQYCVRPEEVDGPSDEAWNKINAHLNTNATSLDELVAELGRRRFGHRPRLADPFCGGGSIPFEAARIGCDVAASDLSPVAALLTWGALEVVGGGDTTVKRVHELQEQAYAKVSRQVQDWGIERNEQGWVADAYLYCIEVRDPVTDWRVPLAPSWVIAEKTNVIARLIPDLVAKRFDIEIVEGVTRAELDQARHEGTAQGGVACPVDAGGNWLGPAHRISTTMDQLRGQNGLRPWENDDVIPRSGDVIQERLYCIRWVDADGKRHYCAPTAGDHAREEQVRALLADRFATWQQKGYLPSTRIEPGSETDRLKRERGWIYWHHLFNPRQLLLNGLFASVAEGLPPDSLEARSFLLLTGRVANWNSRLCGWLQPQGGGIGGGTATFYNQALNTLVNYSCRTTATLRSAFSVPFTSRQVLGTYSCQPGDARDIDTTADIWMTDPGYADMVNYEELSEFFLAWYEKRLPQLFPAWYATSKRALAVAGKGQDFRRAMVECYRHFSENMPPNGLQIVTFTHQDAEVWSDLALILWAAGLRVTSAWTVGTETGIGAVKKGNYVQGTVLLVLRKRLLERNGDMADIYPDLQLEVQNQMQAMLDLDPKDDPNFGDSDYQLAAYAAALRVITSYSSIDEIDVERELYKDRVKGQRSPLAALIERAVKIASDYLVPDGLARTVWRKLTPEERLYMKGVEVEAHGEYREGVYQEFARGFGVGEYRWMLGNSDANQARLKTPSEFKGRDLTGQGFAGSLLRQLLYAIWTTASDADLDPRPARTYLKQELTDYWEQRPMVVELLRYLAGKPRTSAPSRVASEDTDGRAPMAHWAQDAEAARLLLGSVENDSI